jgi:hypothetical protein
VGNQALDIAPKLRKGALRGSLCFLLLDKVLDEMTRIEPYFPVLNLLYTKWELYLLFNHHSLLECLCRLSIFTQKPQVVILATRSRGTK